MLSYVVTQSVADPSIHRGFFLLHPLIHSCSYPSTLLKAASASARMRPWHAGEGQRVGSSLSYPVQILAVQLSYCGGVSYRSPGVALPPSPVLEQAAPVVQLRRASHSWRLRVARSPPRTRRHGGCRVAGAFRPTAAGASPAGAPRTWKTFLTRTTTSRSASRRPRQSRRKRRSRRRSRPSGRHLGTSAACSCTRTASR